MTAPLLDARGLVKSYGGRRVVDALDLRCHAGSVLGLLGPNGAGKTTTLRMLYGFVEPEAGTLRFEGRDFGAERERVKRIIGVCTQDDTLDHDFTVRQNLRVYAGYFRPAVPDLGARVDELLGRFGLLEHAHKKPDQLSGGFKKRLLIARSVVHRPRILFLDEPTTGLDPRARVEVWELVDAMRAEGLGIVLTTHYMDEAEKLSDELLVIDRGKDVARGTTASVLGDLVGEHVIVVPRDVTDRDAVVAWLRGETGREPATVLGEVRAPLTNEQLGRFSERFGGLRFAVREPSLDDLFLALSLAPPRPSAQEAP